MRAGGAHLTGMDTTGGTAAHSTQAGTLTLAVWPDTPLGGHQRYGYRITDTTTGRSLEGRDLFTGAGAPVTVASAPREPLSSRLSRSLDNWR